MILKIDNYEVKVIDMTEKFDIKENRTELRIITELGDSTKIKDLINKVKNSSVMKIINDDKNIALNEEYDISSYKIDIDIRRTYNNSNMYKSIISTEFILHNEELESDVSE